MTDNDFAVVVVAAAVDFDVAVVTSNLLSDSDCCYSCCVMLKRLRVASQSQGCSASSFDFSKRIVAKCDFEIFERWVGNPGVDDFANHSRHFWQSQNRVHRC